MTRLRTSYKPILCQCLQDKQQGGFPKGAVFFSWNKLPINLHIDICYSSNKKEKAMRICKTLDYIVDTDLHLFLFTKIEYLRCKGIKIETTITDFITNLPRDFVEVLDLVLDNACDSISEFHEKILSLHMHLIGGKLHCIIQYPAYKCSKGMDLDKALKKYKNISYSITNNNSITTQYLTEM